MPTSNANLSNTSTSEETKLRKWIHATARFFVFTGGVLVSWTKRLAFWRHDAEPNLPRQDRRLEKQRRKELWRKARNARPRRAA